MATCQICKYSGTPTYKSPCSECKGFSQYEYEKKQTNADRIRAMNDEKLAEFLFRFEHAMEEIGAAWDCQNEALQWLRELADQDDDDDEDSDEPDEKERRNEHE